MEAMSTHSRDKFIWFTSVLNPTAYTFCIYDKVASIQVIN